MKLKKVLASLLAAFSLFFLAACGNGSSGEDAAPQEETSEVAEDTSATEEESEESTEAESSEEEEDTEASGDKVQVVATTTQVSDLVKQVGGDLVEVETLMGPGVDPHGYEPQPSDVQKIDDAQVLAYNGLHLEAMFTDIFEQMEESGKDIIKIEDAVAEDQLLESDEEGEAGDPHVWFSVPIWKQAASYVADQLSAVDPDNEETYQANAEAYVVELDELDDYIKERVSEIPEESRYLITAHDAFNYLGHEYGIEVVGIQGMNTQSEAGVSDITELANLIIENNVDAVFVESSVSDRNVQALVEAVEAQGGTLEIGGELYSDSLGDEASGADTYVTMYKTNIDTIVDALK